jgi:DNA-binding winged helix-turn-helix (wHTH) protein
MSDGASAVVQRMATRISFDPFVLDPDTRQLLRGDREIHLSPKALELLMALAASRPRVLSKAALQEHLWPDTFVAEANLSNLLAEVREALGDSARAPRFIRTAHGFGYAFCGQATSSEDVDDRLAAPACWLEWNRKRFPLSIGEHVIGRDADVAVTLDAATVSRRHARIIVGVENTVIEDFGSKNGTFRGGDRITAPVRLADGDAIRIGSLLLTFHDRVAAMSTETQTQTQTGL